MKKPERQKTILLGMLFLIDAIGAAVRGDLWSIILAVAMFAISVYWFNQVLKD